VRTVVVGHGVALPAQSRSGPRRRSGLRPWAHCREALRQRAAAQLRTGRRRGFRLGPTLSIAFKARARGTVAARHRAARCMAPGGDGALTRGPRRGKEETDRWGPVVGIFPN
jgi:hypothetical protein